MHEVIQSIPRSSRVAVLPTTKPGDGEEAIWLLVDEIAETEGVSYEYAWRLAAMRLAALKERNNATA